MMILTVLWKIWFYLFTMILVIVIGVFWVLPLSFSSKTYPLAYKGIYVWALLVFYLTGFRLDYKEKLTKDKNQSYMLVSNHTSVIDILLMAMLHPDHPMVFVGKAELAKIPIFGRIYKQIAIMVDRSSARSRARVFTMAKDKIDLGNSIVIFPEGGVPDDTSIVLDDFKDGAFSIAISTDLPIVVYSIKGLKEMFPFNFWKGYPGKVKVELLDIIETKELSQKDKDMLKLRVYNLLYQSLTS